MVEGVEVGVTLRDRRGVSTSPPPYLCTMLYLASFTFNPFSENTYVIYNDKREAWIVDPGMYHQEEVKELTDFLEEKNLTPRAIINTHTHIDHIFGVPALKNKYNIPFHIHESDLPVLQGAKGSAMLFGFNYPEAPKPDGFIPHGHKWQLGDEAVDILFVPGHSPGSIAFYYAPGNWLISGDALFNGSIGRSDLPGGNHETLINSIKNELFPLPEETKVYSGHGPATTIGQEKKSNPFLQ